MIRFLVALAVVVLPWAAHAGAVGFARLDVPYAGHMLAGAVWYPTAAPAGPRPIGPYTMTVAPGAPVAGRDLPLIVMSHGNGGEGLGHFDTAIALAEAGFVVASITHEGDNYQVHTDELRLWKRPVQISALITAALARYPVDPRRVGMFGFSAGGFTTLVVIGGKPDFSRIPAYCATHAAAFVCTIQHGHETMLQGESAHADWHADPRVRAAVVAAPALGFTFTKAGLEGVRVPVQLWAAARDHVLPVPDNAGWVRDALPVAPDWHLITGGDHFTFLPPCPALFVAQGLPICRDPAGFDRATAHAAFDREVVRFFKATLSR